MMFRKIRIKAFVLALLLMLVLLPGCKSVPQLTLPEESETTTVPATVQEAEEPEPEPAPTTAVPEETTPPEPEPINIRITAVGDILLHNTVSLSCKTADGGFDFDPLFERVTPLIQGSDIAFVNQEVMLTGEVSNYPRFAAPGEVADALKNAGFNVVNLATNHTMDKGGDGLEKCLENINARNFDAVLGAFESDEQSKEYIIIEKQGIKFGFLSYTYGLNGLPLPTDKPWMVSVLSEKSGDAQANLDRIASEVEAIRPLCDYLIVSMHWGVEYTHSPTKTQLSQAQLLCEKGVDLIIGHHPHVLQPLEWLESESGHQTLVMYSLGNFISNQQKNATLLGGLLEVNLTFDPETLDFVTDAGVIPVVTHYENKRYTTYPIYEYTEELAAGHGIQGIENGENALSLLYLTDLSEQVLGAFAQMTPPSMSAQPPEPPSLTNPINYPDIEGLEFSDLYGMEFLFSSGAGAWRTTVEIMPDGTFRGYYSDADADILYECYFHGQFSNLKKTDEYTYSMKCELLVAEGIEGEERMEDGRTIITSTPYGFDEADEFKLYLPGKKTDELPEEFLDWTNSRSEDMLITYGLYNVGGEQGFRLPHNYYWGTDEWIGSYTFHEAETAYTITVYKENEDYFAHVEIDGQRAIAKVYGSSEQITLVLYEVLTDDTGVFGDKIGGRMISFRKGDYTEAIFMGDSFYTYWGAMQPMLPENKESNNVYFTKQN